MTPLDRLTMTRLTMTPVPVVVAPQPAPAAPPGSSSTSSVATQPLAALVPCYDDRRMVYLCLLNSLLLEWVFQLQSNGDHVGVNKLRGLPFPRVSSAAAVAQGVHASTAVACHRWAVHILPALPTMQSSLQRPGDLSHVVDAAWRCVVTCLAADALPGGGVVVPLLNLLIGAARYLQPTSPAAPTSAAVVHGSGSGSGSGGSSSSRCDMAARVVMDVGVAMLYGVSLEGFKFACTERLTLSVRGRRGSVGVSSLT